MERSHYQSGFADEIREYLDSKKANGFNESSYSYILSLFDQFCCDHGIRDVRFTQDDAIAWTKRREVEGTTTHYARVNKTKNFLIHLQLKGYDLYVPRDIHFKPSDFQPHIYTDDEVVRYFEAVDTYESVRSKADAVQFPVLFRLLYCCGTRINETLGIKKKDVDLESGIVKLRETKNGEERYVVLGSDLLHLMRRFADKSFYLLLPDDYIFPSSFSQRRTGDALHEVHRKLLRKAGIPFLGDKKGPRIHDWRHTAAVCSFKQLIDQGMDMYVALPILSTYLGHKTIYATERYLRLTMSLYPYIADKCSQKFLEIFGEEVTSDETD